MTKYIDGVSYEVLITVNGERIFCVNVHDVEAGRKLAEAPNETIGIKVTKTTEQHEVLRDDRPFLAEPEFAAETTYEDPVPRDTGVWEHTGKTTAYEDDPSIAGEARP